MEEDEEIDYLAIMLQGEEEDEARRLEMLKEDGDEEYEMRKLPYSYYVHNKKVLQWQDEVCTEESLGYFFCDEHLNAHRRIITEFLRHCQIETINIVLDKKSVYYMYAIGLKQLTSLLARVSASTHKMKEYDCQYMCTLRQHWNDSHKLRLSLVKTRSYIDLDDEEHDCICIMDDSDTEIDKANIETSTDMAIITSLSKEFVSQREAMIEKMKTFYHESQLVEYYEKIQKKKNHFLDVQTEVLAWFEKCFRTNHTLVRIDTKAESCLLLQQWFTSDTYPLTDILNLTIDHTWLVEKSLQRDPFVKTILDLNCIPLETRSPYLRDQLRVNKNIFTNCGAYAAAVVECRKKGAINTNPIIHVCFVRQKGAIQSMAIFDKPAYDLIQDTLKGKKELNGYIEDLENDHKLKSYANRPPTQTESAGKDLLCAYISHEINKNASPFLNVRQEEREFLSHRAIVISCLMSGLEGARKTLEGCLGSLVKKARDTFEENGGADSFSGEMILSRDVMDPAHLDHKTMKRLLMNDDVNRFTLTQCIERRVKADILSIKMGEDTLSRCIVPCVSNYHYYYVTNNNTIVNNNNCTFINNNNNNDDDATRGTKVITTEKRKRRGRKDEEFYDKVKRIRLFKESKICGDRDENDLPFYKLVKTTVSAPIAFTDQRQCSVCDTTKIISNFFPSATQRKEVEQGAENISLNNICHACIKMYHVLNRK